MDSVGVFWRMPQVPRVIPPRVRSLLGSGLPPSAQLVAMSLLSLAVGLEASVHRSPSVDWARLCLQSQHCSLHLTCSCPLPAFTPHCLSSCTPLPTPPQIPLHMYNPAHNIFQSPGPLTWVSAAIQILPYIDCCNIQTFRRFRTFCLLPHEQFPPAVTLAFPKAPKCLHTKRRSAMQNCSCILYQHT